jgi:hypothetical protein
MTGKIPWRKPNFCCRDPCQHLTCVNVAFLLGGHMTLSLVREPANSMVNIKEPALRGHPSRGLTCWGRSTLCEGEQQM